MIAFGAEATGKGSAHGQFVLACLGFGGPTIALAATKTMQQSGTGIRPGDRGSHELGRSRHLFVASLVERRRSPALQQDERQGADASEAIGPRP